MTITQPDTQIITPYDPPSDQQRRRFAELITRRGEEEVYAQSLGKKMPYEQYMAMMLWDYVTSGEILFADGRKITCENYTDWISTVKFLTQHVDGPVGKEISLGVNLYKVYMDIDESLV